MLAVLGDELTGRMQPLEEHGELRDNLETEETSLPGKAAWAAPAHALLHRAMEWRGRCGADRDKRSFRMDIEIGCCMHKRPIPVAIWYNGCKTHHARCSMHPQGKDRRLRSRVTPHGRTRNFSADSALNVGAPHPCASRQRPHAWSLPRSTSSPHVPCCTRSLSNPYARWHQQHQRGTPRRCALDSRPRLTRLRRAQRLVRPPLRQRRRFRPSSP